MTAVPAEFRDRVKASLDKLMPKARVELEAVLAHPVKLAKLYADTLDFEKGRAAAREKAAYEQAIAAGHKLLTATARPLPAPPVAAVAHAHAPAAARPVAAAPVLLDRKQQAQAAAAYALEHKCDFTEACQRLGFGVVGAARSSPQWSPPAPARGTPEQQAAEAGAYAAKHGVGFVEACKVLDVSISGNRGTARLNFDGQQLQRRPGPERIAA